MPVSRVVDTSSYIHGEYTKISLNHTKFDRFIFGIKHKKIYNDLVKKYKFNEYSIVHAHSLFSNGYIALKLKQNYGIPYVVAVRNTDVNTFFKYMVHLRSLGVKILVEAEKVVFLSESYMNLIIEKYVPVKFKEKVKHKSIIIPNGIDDFWFQNKWRAKNFHRKDNLKLIYVGVINKNKNLITTVKAIELLQNMGYSVTFSIVGRIEDNSIYQKIKDLPFVNYITPKSKEELVEIYRANDIFVMPSLTETFGLVYAEAMSQGLPVIYSKGQGFDGQFKEGQVGYSINATNPNELTDKLIRILENYNEISKACLNNVTKFRWDEISNQYGRIYLECGKISN